MEIPVSAIIIFQLPEGEGVAVGIAVSSMILQRAVRTLMYWNPIEGGQNTMNALKHNSSSIQTPRYRKFSASSAFLLPAALALTATMFPLPAGARAPFFAVVSSPRPALDLLSQGPGEICY